MECAGKFHSGILGGRVAQLVKVMAAPMRGFSTGSIDSKGHGNFKPCTLGCGKEWAGNFHSGILEGRVAQVVELVAAPTLRGFSTGSIDSKCTGMFHLGIQGQRVAQVMTAPRFRGLFTESIDSTEGNSDPRELRSLLRRSGFCGDSATLIGAKFQGETMLDCDGRLVMENGDGDVRFSFLSFLMAASPFSRLCRTSKAAMECAGNFHSGILGGRVAQVVKLVAAPTLRGLSTGSIDSKGPGNFKPCTLGCGAEGTGKSHLGIQGEFVGQVMAAPRFQGPFTGSIDSTEGNSDPRELRSLLRSGVCGPECCTTLIGAKFQGGTMLACDGRLVMENGDVYDNILKLFTLEDTKSICYAVAGCTTVIRAVEGSIEGSKHSFESASSVVEHISSFCRIHDFKDAAFLVADPNQVFRTRSKDAWTVYEGEVVAAGLGGVLIEDWLIQEYASRKKSDVELAGLFAEGLQKASTLTDISGANGYQATMSCTGIEIVRVNPVMN